MTRRNVLLITYYFPPSGGSGVQRPTKFVKYLPQFGWDPIVLTVQPEFAAYPNLDSQLETDIPAEIQVHRTKSWDPYTLYGHLVQKKKQDLVSVGFISEDSPGFWDYVARWIRANIFLPDARVGWNNYALKEAEEIINSNVIDVIITTGPPHSTHIIGKKLNRRYNIPWVADFRDPWTEIDYLERLPLTRIARKINSRLEQSVLDNANAILVVSPAMMDSFKQKTQTRCVTIYNGFDHEDFVSSENYSPQDDAFVIAHIGNMNADRNPENVWRVIGQNYREGKLEKLKIRLIGNADSSVLASIRDEGIEHLLEQSGYLAHDKAIHQLQRSTILLLPINRVPSAKGIITGKLFEYLASNKPILGVGPVDGDAAKIIYETGSGEMIHFDDTNKIDDFIKQSYRSWEKGNAFRLPDREKVDAYSRSKLTQRLTELMNELIS